MHTENDKETIDYNMHTHLNAIRSDCFNTCNNIKHKFRIFRIFVPYNSFPVSSYPTLPLSCLSHFLKFMHMYKCNYNTTVLCQMARKASCSTEYIIYC